MHQKDKIVILSAVRTPIGSFNGCLSPLASHTLGAQVIKASISQAQLQPDNIDEVVMGQVLTAGQGQNPARQAAVAAGLPFSVPAFSLNMVCGSGIRSIVNGMKSIKCGDADIVVCGGQESMSQAPHAQHLRKAKIFGSCVLEDTLISDGLTDAFHKYQMGVTAENLATKYEITREQQDAYSLQSQHKTQASQEAGHFDNEIVEVSVKSKGKVIVINADEFPHHNSTIEGLAKLKPCFVDDPKLGTVTPGNCTGLNDGAAAVVLSSQFTADKKNLKPLAHIVSWGQCGVAPEVMGTGPIGASRSAIQKAGWAIGDVDLWEINEAFAAQTLTVISELGLDKEKVNVSGGAIALGHPLGASGTRIVVTLVHNLRRLNKRRGVATLCIGGGMGLAICIEALP